MIKWIDEYWFVVLEKYMWNRNCFRTVVCLNVDDWESSMALGYYGG